MIRGRLDLLLRVIVGWALVAAGWATLLGERALATSWLSLLPLGIAAAGSLLAADLMIGRLWRAGAAFLVYTGLLAATAAGWAAALFSLLVAAPMAALVGLSYRLRPAQPASPLPRPVLALALLAIGAMTPPLIEVLAASIDPVRRTNLVDALAATDTARRPRGDMKARNWQSEQVAMRERSDEGNAFLTCGGKPLPRGGLPSEWERSTFLTALIDGYGADEDERHFRSNVAEGNSAFRLKVVQLCIGAGFCRKMWTAYVIQPDERSWRRLRASGENLPATHAVAEQVTRDAACGLGVRLSRNAKPRPRPSRP